MTAKERKISIEAVAGASISSKHIQTHRAACRLNKTRISDLVHPLEPAMPPATASHRKAGTITRKATTNPNPNAPPLVKDDTKVEWEPTAI
jgi:hypothetical protein